MWIKFVPKKCKFGQIVVEKEPALKYKLFSWKCYCHFSFLFTLRKNKERKKREDSTKGGRFWLILSISSIIFFYNILLYFKHSIHQKKRVQIFANLKSE